MAKKNITIGFPEEKLNVLLYFLNREQQNLEPLLEEQLDRLYNRTVPKQTRDFIQFQMTGELATETEENQEESQEEPEVTIELVEMEQQASQEPSEQTGEEDEETI